MFFRLLLNNSEGNILSILGTSYGCMVANYESYSVWQNVSASEWFIGVDT